jgi:CheY-like chemotaxis protein
VLRQPDNSQIIACLLLATSLGEAAVELARLHKPDLILLDIQLPDISGLEAARRLKAEEQTRAIPIIALTAFAMQGDEAKVLASGWIERRPPRLDLTVYPYLPRARVATTAAKAYLDLLAGAAP